MSWFDRWLARKVRKGLNQQKEVDERHAINFISAEKYPSVRPQQSDSLDSFPDLNFRMYKAYNGWVMEVRHTDKRTDRHTMTMHIINESEDLGDSIAKIITIEALKS